MYRKYLVYLDDGDFVYKVAIAAENKDKAIEWCAGNGEVIAVRDVTDKYPIDVNKIRAALGSTGFGLYEQDFVCRSLEDFGIAY